MRSSVVEDSLRETLHDHYKETFQYIRERETLRDRLFLFLIALYAVLAVQIQYPRKFDGSVETINLLGVQVDVSSLSLAALLSATWVFVLAVVLRYCQTTMNIERQYDYLHKVEGRLSPEFGDDVYCREGEHTKTSTPASRTGRGASTPLSFRWSPYCQWRCWPGRMCLA